jgi:hypothetical protein
MFIISLPNCVSLADYHKGTRYVSGEKIKRNGNPISNFIIDSHFVMLNPGWLALVAGTVYHFTVRYSNQAKLFKTFVIFTLSNAVFLAFDVSSTLPSSSLSFTQISLDILIFNTVYVCSLWENF